MLFNDVDKSKPHTVLMISEPVRLAALSFAGLARGVYYIQGDFRPKIAKPHDKRLVQVGLIALRYIDGAEQLEATEASPSLAAVAASTVTQVETAPNPPYDGWAPQEPAELKQYHYPRPVDAPTVATEQLPIATVAEAVATETAPVVTEVAPVTNVAEVVATEAAPVATETLMVATEDDQEPVVILDGSEEPKPKKNKGGRPRKPKAGNVVAPAEDAAKLPEHEQDRGSTEPVPAPPAEDSIPNKDGQALA